MSETIIYQTRLNMAPQANAWEEEIPKVGLAPLVRHTFWSMHNKRILKGCSLVAVPMSALTISMLYLVFANQIDPKGCPLSELCFNSDQTITVSVTTDDHQARISSAWGP